MLGFRKARLLAAAAMMVAAATFAMPASAADMGSMKDEAPAPEPDLKLAASVALTTDYVFRGISQTDESFAVQGTFDATYKMFYAGAFASNLDFGGFDPDGAGPIPGSDIADIEIDLYGGIRPTWNKLTFDFGGIGYLYPNSRDDALGGNIDYFEFKAGVSTTVWEKLALGVNFYYSPDNFAETGDNFVVEGSAGYTFDKFWVFTPTLSGVLGRQEGDEGDGGFDYTYWNVGLTLAFYDKPALSLDLRYWDTSDVPYDCDSGIGGVFQCDARFVGTIKASF